MSSSNRGVVYMGPGKVEVQGMAVLGKHRHGAGSACSGCGTRCGVAGLGVTPAKKDTMENSLL